MLTEIFVLNETFFVHSITNIGIDNYKIMKTRKTLVF